MRLDAAVVEMPCKILEIGNLLPRKPAAAQIRVLHAEDVPGRDFSCGGNDAIPHRLRRLDGNLLAGDRAGEGGEGIAAAAKICFGIGLDEFSKDRVASCKQARGVVPVIGSHERGLGLESGGKRSVRKRDLRRQARVTTARQMMSVAK